MVRAGTLIGSRLFNVMTNPFRVGDIVERLAEHTNEMCEPRPVVYRVLPKPRDPSNNINIGEGCTNTGWFCGYFNLIQRHES
jgi:hypothetical protein